MIPAYDKEILRPGECVEEGSKQKKEEREREDEDSGIKNSTIFIGARNFFWAHLSGAFQLNQKPHLESFLGRDHIRNCNFLKKLQIRSPPWKAQKMG